MNDVSFLHCILWTVVCFSAGEAIIIAALIAVRRQAPRRDDITQTNGRQTK
jgi:hypothetical protein